MRTTITLDDDIYKLALHISKTSGKRLGRVVSELVRRGIKSKSINSSSNERFPTFMISPQTKVITSAEVYKFLSDEDSL